MLRLRTFEGAFSSPSAIFARRATSSILAIALWAAGLFLALALASWTVTDPSLTHATAAPVENWMGRPGAAFADPIMQVFGLAAPLLVVPFCLWGTRLLAGRPLGIDLRRVGAGIAALFLAPAFLNAFPVTGAWPLPIGLGGVVGEAWGTLLLSLTGDIPALAGAVAGVFGLLAAALLWLAVSPPRVRTAPPALGFQIRRHALEDDYDLDNTDAFEDDTPRWSAALGMVIHHAGTLAARTRRLAGIKRRMPRASAYTRPTTEPAFARQPADDAPLFAPTFDDDEARETPPPGGHPTAPQRTEAAATEARPRVRPTARAERKPARPRRALPKEAVIAPEEPAARAAPAEPAAPRNFAYQRPLRGPAANLQSIVADALADGTLGAEAAAPQAPQPPAHDAGADIPDQLTAPPTVSQASPCAPPSDWPEAPEIRASAGPAPVEHADDTADLASEDDDVVSDDEALYEDAADDALDTTFEPEDDEIAFYDEPEPDTDETDPSFLDEAMDHGDVVDDFDTDDDEEERALAAAADRYVNAPAPAAPRVQPATTAIPPGRRVIKEAQPSFLQSAEYEFPPLALLAAPKAGTIDDELTEDALEANARVLEGVLEDFGVRGSIIHVRPGPVVTLYELEPAPGIKSSRVIGLADDIARSMSAISARVAVIPGKNAIGIELPNRKRITVFLRELLASQDFERTKAKLPLCLGKTIGGEAVIADLARMPHLLVAGTTGSGKSVSINTMILSLLYWHKPEACRVILIDPKMLELSVYDGIPHLLTPVVTDPKKAVSALKWAVREMEDRYRKMAKLGVRNIDGFNTRLREADRTGEPLSRIVQTGFDKRTGEAIFEEEILELAPMPYIVVIVDEMADLMMVAGKEIEGAIQRLAQMARAAGLHLIMATQRPSVDVITGTIKANFPTRISFQVTSKIDSRTVLGEMGAEQLLGMGDMLYMAGGGRIQRVHGPFVSDEEVEEIVLHLRQQGTPEYLTEVLELDDDDEPADAVDASSGLDALAESEDLYDRAVALVLRDRKASTSYVQRRLSIGYNRAATLIERMENEGVVSPANHAGKREILVPAQEDAA